MKKQTYLWLVPAGLLFSSGALFAKHFIAMPDFVLGALQGVGIGIMLMALIIKKKIAHKQA